MALADFALTRCSLCGSTGSMSWGNEGLCLRCVAQLEVLVGEEEEDAMGLNVLTGAVGDPEGQVTILCIDGPGQQRKIQLTREEACELKKSLSQSTWAFEKDALQPFSWEAPYGGNIHGVAVVITLDEYNALKRCQRDALRRAGADIIGLGEPLQVVDTFFDLQTKLPMAVLWGSVLSEKGEGKRYQVVTVEAGKLSLVQERHHSDNTIADK